MLPGLVTAIATVIALALLDSPAAQAKGRCKLGSARLVDWTKLSGIWYNTFSHESDSLRLVGRCNSMVVAGTFGFDGVAVVRNVLSNSDAIRFPIRSVSEFFIALDPGIYQIDKSSEYQWIQTPLLEKIMPPRNVTDFVNAIAQHYSIPFAVTTSDHNSFFVMRQCSWRGESSVWVYTKSPHPEQAVIKRIDQHLRFRKLSTTMLTKNSACEDALNSIYTKANGPK